MKTNFKNVTIRESTLDMLRFLSEVTDRSMCSLLDELVEYIFNIACTFESANFEYEVDGDSVKVVLTGRNNLVCGEQKMPKEVLKKENEAGETLMVKFKGEKTFKKVKN